MLNKLTIEEVPDSLKDVAQAIGMESFKKLIKLIGGMTIYIPSERNITKSIRNKAIKENFKGDYRQIARMYNLSEVQARNIINN